MGTENLSTTDAQTAVGSIDEIFAGNGLDRYLCARDEIVLPRGAQLIVRGWAANPQCTAPARSLEARLNGRCVPTRYGLLREDVALVHNSARLRSTGFALTIDTSILDLDLGDHEVVLRTRDGESETSFAPLRIRIVEGSTAPSLRLAKTGLFDIAIDAFHSSNRPKSLEARIEHRFVAIIIGKLSERDTGKPPTSIYGVIDGFDGTYGQMGYRSATNGEGPNGFLLCFASLNLAPGRHEICLIATNQKNEIENVATLPFTIVPMCCGATVPFSSPEIARAHVEWIEPKDSYRKGDLVGIRGWAVDPIGGQAPGEAFLRFEDGRAIALSTRQRRDDVPESVRSHDASHCGFVGSIAFEHFDIGHHVGRVHIDSKDETRTHVSDATIEFDIVES